MRVIAHSGVVSPALAEGLADAGVDGVMLDIIGADETIRDVYHLDLTAADFERSLALLADRGLRIIPHVVCGLHYGRFLGEYRALEMIARYPVSTLIIVVLVPLVGTPMAHLPPPPVADVVDFFAAARAALPTTKVNLGCARPLGAMKRELDAGGRRPRPQRHRLSRRRYHRLRPVPGARTQALRVLLLAHLGGRRRRSLVRNLSSGGHPRTPGLSEGDGMTRSGAC